MDNKLFTYAFVKGLYEQKKDYIDTFYPFILKILSEKEKLDINLIQAKVKENYGLDIPEHSLKSIITRASKHGYIEQQKWRVSLTEKGIKYLNRLESENEVNRRISELLEDIRNHLNEPQLTFDEVYDIVLTFVNENIYTLVRFFNPVNDANRINIPKKKIREYEDKLVKYFEIAEKQKHYFYKILQEIVYGSVISTAASSPNIAEIDKKFKGVQVFLDTNFMLSIFELQFSEFNRQAQELLNLLKLNGFELKVFDFTVEEIVRVLKNYPVEQHMYVPSIKVDSIYSNLKNKGWTTEDMREFIRGIEERIWTLCIKIEPTGLELKNYKPQKKEYLSCISKYKSEQSEQSRNHDLAAIEKIEEIRNTRVREIKRSKALFLTSDSKLFNCNYLEWGHKESMTVCEVILDRLLTNILWLKNPMAMKAIPLKSIIAIHSREILIDRMVWKRFYENTRKLKEDGHINDRDISMLFYDHSIEEFLSKFDVSDVNDITSELILEKIENARTSIDIEIQEDREIFEKQITQKELEKEQKWEKKLEQMKGLLEVVSKRKAKTCVSVLSCIFVICVSLLLFRYMNTIIKNWNVIEPISYVITFFIALIISLLGDRITLKRVKSGLEILLFNRIYRKRLHELELKNP